jgi:hypothetical protein
MGLTLFVNRSIIDTDRKNKTQKLKNDENISRHQAAFAWQLYR